MYKQWKRLLKNGRGFKKDEGGVSEILGDILLVSVVIVVVGSIAAQVVNVEKPRPSKTTDFEARIDGDDLVITHMGGRTLKNQFTDIRVGVGPTPTQFFKIKDGFPGNKLEWKISEEWRHNISSDITASTTTGQDLYVEIMDLTQNMILLDQVLISGTENQKFPDVGFEPGSLKFSNEKPNGGERINISTTLVNYGAVDVTNIEVRFFDDKTLIGINKSVTLLKKAGSVGDTIVVKLDWNTTYLGRHVISAKIVPKSNETNLANNYISGRLNVGFGVNLDFTRPNLVVVKFTISNEKPLSKEPVILKALIANTAKIQATSFTLVWGEIFQGVNTTLYTSSYVGNVTYVNDVEMSYEWTPQKGGEHHLWVHIDTVIPSEDPKANADPVIDADWGELDVTVMPRVLLVDDDMAGKGTKKDTSTYMKESLKGIGVSYDTITVGAGDGPQYNGTGITLERYDIVIWMTGYESTNTLTTSGGSSDIKNLKNFLDNNGSLWLIGQDVADDLINNGGANGQAFLKNYLRVNSQTLNIQLGSAIYGNSACDPVKDLQFNTSVPVNVSARPDLINPDASSISAMDNQTHQNISLLYNQSYKLAYFAFEFSQIKMHSERAILTYRILEWFNATVFFSGSDLAVSEVTITPPNPHYKQEVQIKAVIRNNGLVEMSNIKVVFKDIYQGIETNILPDVRDRAGTKVMTDNPMSVNLTAMGGQNLTLKYWVPERTGMHQIKVVVDPNDVIQEIDEDNNEFISDLTSTEVYVDSITLIVDDDQTLNGAKNTTDAIVKSMDFLNYKYEVFKVPNAASDGPNLDNLTKYNNVVWCFGNESTDGTTFTASDMTNVFVYLTGYQGNIWVIGQNFLEDDAVRNNISFRRNLLGINGFNRNIATPTTLIGIKNQNITHGMRYSTARTFGSDEADAVTPHSGAENLFLNSGGLNFATAMYNTSGVNYKAVITTFEYSFITDPYDRRELAYMLFHWFDQSDSRIELRITYEDMYFARDNGPPIAFDSVKPVLGASYILQAKVWNVGNTPIGATVRFLDGTTVISSASIYIPATAKDASGNIVLGSELAEVIWSPLFGGTRPITIKVDPDRIVPVVSDPRSSIGEIMKKNNNVTRQIEVFFFYDDLENGPANWTHEATLMRINGEQSLEYFDTLRPVDTNVVSLWNNMTGSWKQLYNDAHTVPSSFMASEPADSGNNTIKLRVGICIEDSAAIGNRDPTLVRLKAAWNFTNDTFSPGDELTVYRMEGASTNLFNSEYPSEGTFEFFPFENISRYLNIANGYFNNAGGVDVKGCIRAATTDLKTSWNTNGIYPALVVITSLQNYGGAGDITQMMDDSRQSGVPIYMVGVGAEPQLKSELLYDIAMVSNGGLFFKASTGAEISNIMRIIGEIIGSGGVRSISDDGSDYSTGSRDGTDSRTTAPSAGNGNSKVILYNPTGTDKWAQGISRNITWFCGNTYTVAECGNPTISFDPGSGVFTAINPISTTKSPYDWTSDSSTFDSAARIWQYNWTVPKVTCNNCRIRVDIKAGTRVVTSFNFQIFDSGLPLGTKHQMERSNITTETINSANYATMRLGFWHKYDLLTAENGGVILVGNSSLPNSGFKYHYVIPVHSYSGNLRNDKVVRDDDNFRMLFAYNGRSAGQTFEWTYDEVDLTKFISASTPYLRIRFMVLAWGYGNGGGWWLDDVTVRASRSDTVAITPTIADQWQYYEWRNGIDSVFLQPHSGTHMWWNHNPASSHDLKSGIDNSLMTKSIDLLNAKDAHLSAYFKFNVNDNAGRPPDGFRVEVSSDNGVTWRPINLGVRASWGVSGNWAVDGKSPDGTQAYTGIQDSGVNTATPEWVKAGSLWRLNTNITGWSGSIIKIRFRVVTNLEPTHYKSATTFRGIAVDDVIIRGNTTLAGAPIQRPSQTGPILDAQGDGAAGLSAENMDGQSNGSGSYGAVDGLPEMTLTWVTKDEVDA